MCLNIFNLRLGYLLRHFNLRIYYHLIRIIDTQRTYVVRGCNRDDVESKENDKVLFDSMTSVHHYMIPASVFYVHGSHFVVI